MEYLGNSDGLILNLYYYLWMKGDSLKASAFPVLIPDTIIYSQGLPQIWYFSSKLNGQILMHKTGHRCNKNIQEYFLRKSGLSEIVAYFIFEDNDQNIEITHEMTASRKSNLNFCQKKSKISILYFDKERFCAFLADPDKKKNGILQRVQINLKLISLLSRLERMKLQFKQSGVLKCAYYQKGSISRGLMIYPMTPRRDVQPLEVRKYFLNVFLSKLVYNIVNKIKGVTFEKDIITRGVFYFKEDKRNRLYFTYCSSIRTKEEVFLRIKPTLNYKQRHNNTPLALGENYTPSKKVKKIITTITQKPANLINDLSCFDCEKKCQQGDLCQISYQSIIRYHHHISQNKRINQEELIKGIDKVEMKFLSNNIRPILITRFFDEQSSLNLQIIEKPELIQDTASMLIPQLLRKFYPLINYKTYKIAKQNDEFLKKNLLICENCYLRYQSVQVQITGVACIQKVLDNVLPIPNKQIYRSRTNFKDVFKNLYHQNSKILTEVREERKYSQRGRNQTEHISRVQSDQNTPIKNLNFGDRSSRLNSNSKLLSQKSTARQVTNSVRSTSHFKYQNTTLQKTDQNLIHYGGDISTNIFGNLDIQHFEQLNQQRSLSSRI